MQQQQGHAQQKMQSAEMQAETERFPPQNNHEMPLPNIHRANQQPRKRANELPYNKLNTQQKKKRISRIIDQSYDGRPPLTVYSQERKMNDQSNYKAIFPITEFILLNILQIFEENRIINIYERDFSDNKIFFVEFETGHQEMEELATLGKIYNVEGYESFKGKSWEIVTEISALPEYIWLPKVDKRQEIETDLVGFKLNFSSLEGNLLIENVEEEKLKEFEVIMEKAKMDGSAEVDHIIISNYLLLEMHEEDTNLLEMFTFLEMEVFMRKTYFSYQNDKWLQYVLQFDNIFQMLAAKSVLTAKKIAFQYISDQFFMHQEYRFKDLSEGYLTPLFNLSEINKQLLASDAINLEMLFGCSEDDFMKQIQFMLNNWSLYDIHHEQDLEKFQDILMAYVNYQQQLPPQKELVHFYNCNRQYTGIAEKAQQLIPKLKKINEYNGEQVKAGERHLIEIFATNGCNNIYGNFVQSAFVKAKKKGEITIINTIVDGTQQKQTLSEYIASIPEFQTRSRKATRWEHLFNRLTLKHFLRTRVNEPEDKEPQARTEYMTGIQTERLLDLSCLGCCQFFYDDQNIRNSEINTTPFKVFGSAEDVEILKDEIKKEMKYFMDHVGGVILFNCQQKDREVLPKSIKWTKPERQEQVKNLLLEYFEELNNEDSNMQIIKSIVVSFVPLIRNPLRHKLKNGKRSYIEQTVVTRVKIERTRKPRTGGDQAEFRQLDFFGPKITCFHQGPCKEPDQLQVKPDKSNKSDKVKSKKVEIQKQPKPLNKYFSLMVDKTQTREKSLKYLKNGEEKLGIQETYYDKLTLKCISSTVAFYHDRPLDEIKQIIEARKKQEEDQINDFARFNKKSSKKENNKKTSYTEIMQFIMLPDQSKRGSFKLRPKDLEDMMSYDDQIKKQLENQEIIFWCFKGGKNQQQQHFFQLKSKMKSLLFYYILHNFSEKAKFKMPTVWQQPNLNRQSFTIEFKSKSTTKQDNLLRTQLLYTFERLKIESFQKSLKQESPIKE